MPNSHDDRSSFGTRLGVAASLVTVLAFFGITNWHSLTGDNQAEPGSTTVTITATPPNGGGNTGGQPVPTDSTPDNSSPVVATTPPNNQPCYDLVNNAQPQADNFESYPPPLDSAAGNSIANQISSLTAELQRDAQAEGVAATRSDMAGAATASSALADDFRANSNNVPSDQAALSSQMRGAINDCQTR